MKEVTSPLPDERTVQPASSIHSDDTDDNRPLELVRPRKDNRGRVRKKFEEVLKPRFDRGKASAVLGFDFLYID